MWQALPFDTAQDHTQASLPPSPSAACHLLCRLIVQPLILDTQLIVQLTGTGTGSVTHDLGGLFQAQLGSMSPDSKDTLGCALISSRVESKYYDAPARVWLPACCFYCLFFCVSCCLFFLFFFFCFSALFVCLGKLRKSCHNVSVNHMLQLLVAGCLSF